MTTLPLAPIAAGAAADLPGVLGRVRERLVAEMPLPLARDYWQATGIMMGLRYEAAVINVLLRGAMDMQESTYYQHIVSIGEARGVSIGEARGEARGERNTIVRWATRRFGSPDPVTLARLHAITDQEHLDRIMMAVPTASDWADLLDA